MALMEAERAPESREHVLELRQVHKSFDYNGKARENLSNHKVLNGINLIIQKNASLWEGTIVGSVVILAVLLNVVGRRRQA